MMKQAEGRAADSERPLILVVEDDFDILSFIAMELGEDYRVLKAVDGREGLELAREHIPDLVVTDLMMPVMDGLELCRILKSDSTTSLIPVVMLTAKTSEENQLEGLKTGADDYVAKPFNMVLLQARIANLLEARRMLRAQFSRQYVPGEQASFVSDDSDREFLDRAASVVKQHYTDWDFTAEEFAVALGMSLRTLQRKLKIIADLSPTGFITDFRMKAASDLLKLTSYTMTEIAFKVGYDESSSFSRVFKKTFDMSPSTYRASHSNS